MAFLARSPTLRSPRFPSSSADEGPQPMEQADMEAVFSADGGVAAEALDRLERLRSTALLAAATQMIREPPAVPLAQLASGARRLAGSVGDVLDEPGLPASAVEDFVRASGQFFLGGHWAGFADEGGDVWMFWDALLNPWRLRRALQAQATLLVGVLAEILRCGSRICKRSALHGLNHIVDSRKEQVLRAFLSQEGDEELRSLAASALVGSLQ